MIACLGDETIAAYVDGALDLDTVARVDGHITRCSNCREQLSAVAASPGAISFVAQTTTTGSLAGIELAIATARPGDPLPEATVGRYVVESVVGRGAMGVVVRARDPELERAVAIKLVAAAALPTALGTVSGAWRSRLRAEARAMARLRHPNVIAVYDAGTVGDQVFVAMELVDGESLARRLSRDRVGVLELCIGAGRGVCAAHAAGLVHGDLKPDNILVDRDGRALVGDFGLARTLAERTSTGAGSVIAGTPAYMAPELLRGAPADFASDQFAFAVTVYEAFAGKRPWTGDSLHALRDAIEREPPTRPQSMPGVVWRAVARALAVAPSKRFPAMADFVDALERARGRRTRRWIAAAAVTGGALVLATIVVASSSGEPAACADPRAQAAALVPACGSLPSSPCAALAAALERRGSAWREAHVAVCQATRDGRQSAALLDHRMACLDDRLREHVAFVERLGTPTDDRVARDALAGVERLETPEACTTADRAARAVRRELAPAVTLAERWIADAHADHALGRYSTGAAELGARLPAIRALGDPSLLAAAAVILGKLQLQVGQLAAAEATFDLGLRAAAEAGDDAMSTRLLVSLAHLLGESRQQWARGGELLRAAEASLVRAGKPPALEAAVLRERGFAAEARNDYAAARADHARALELLRRTGPSTEIANALQALCIVARSEGKLAEARRHCDEAFAVVFGALGADHPLVAEAEINLGVTFAVTGELATARERWQAALARLERGLGTDAPALAAVLINLEDVSRALEDNAAADRYLARAFAITASTANSTELVNLRIRVANQLLAAGRTKEGLEALEDITRRARATLGATHRETAHALEDLGTAYYTLGRYADARATWGEALAASTALYGERHPTTLAGEGRYGQAMMAMNDATAARPVFEHALLALEATVAGDSPYLANAYVNYADALIAVGDATGAVDPAQKGFAIYERRGDDPLQLSEARFVLARALWSARRDRTALVLARTARDEMRAIGPRATTLPDIERWLARAR